MPYCETSSGKIHYEIKGRERNGNSNPVVFLHCWAGSSRFWRHQMQALEENHLCLALDYPGHGKSERAEDDAYGPVPFAEVAREVIEDVFGGQKVSLVGHSLGGMVAMHLALNHTEIINTLVLFSTSAHLRGYAGHREGTFFVELVSPLLSPFTKSVGMYFTAMHPMTPLDVREDVRKVVLSVKNDVVTKTLKGINCFNVSNELHRLNMPVLILKGSLDLYTDIRHALSLQLSIPNAKLRIVPMSGHMGMLENPHWVNKTLREFFKKHHKERAGAGAGGARKNKSENKNGEGHADKE